MRKHRNKTVCKGLLFFAKRHRGEIAYYACVFAVLCAIAWGAENYRSGREREQLEVLPAAETAVTEAQKPACILPGGTCLIAHYSALPVWNETDRSWQAHPAADYTCADGKVLALSMGKVIAVSESGITGGCIEIQCEDVLLKYCNVQPEENIAPGMKIKMGEMIGAVQNAMPGEMHLGAHLHLEAYRSGRSVDPQTLLADAD